jgi:hypothetical protein
VILDRAPESIDEYNRTGLHYNRVAETIYRARETADPFSAAYELHLMAGLIAFDMGRRMRKGDKCDPACGFRRLLHDKMGEVHKHLADMRLVCLAQADLTVAAASVQAAYDCLASPGPGALDSKGQHFHVGATKILHWIAPALFIIVDRNVARSFRKHHVIDFKSGTQPGYSAEKYVECLRKAQEEIHAYGYERLCSIEPQTPLARLFDKVAFVVGKGLQRHRE